MVACEVPEAPLNDQPLGAGSAWTAGCRELRAWMVAAIALLAHAQNSPDETALQNLADDGTAARWQCLGELRAVRAAGDRRHGDVAAADFLARGIARTQDADGVPGRGLDHLEHHVDAVVRGDLVVQDRRGYRRVGLGP